MDRGSATVGEQGEDAGIIAALHCGLPDQVGHVRVGDTVDAGRGFHDAHAHRRSDLFLDGLDSLLPVQLHSPAQEVVWIQVSKDKVSVGYGGLRAAHGVAYGPGTRTGTLGTHFQKLRLRLDPGDAPAARPDGFYPDLRTQETVPHEHRSVVPFHSPVADNADLEGSPAHVRGQNVLLADKPPEKVGTDHSGCGTRLNGGNSALAGRVDAPDAAVRLHNEGLLGEAQSLQGGLKRSQVSRDLGAHVRIEDGGDGPLVLSQEGSGLARATDEDARVFLLQDLFDGVLVSIVGDGPQEADGY